MLRLAGALLVIALAAAAFIWTRHNAAKRNRAAAGLKDVESTLQKAHLVRTQMDVQIVSQGESNRFMRGPCAAVDSGRLLIDTNLPYAVNSWIGRKAHVYFQLRGAAGMEYYDFFSPVSRVLPYKTGYALELTLPGQLNNNQKRTFVRLEPLDSMITEMMLWYVPPHKGTPVGLGSLRQGYSTGDIRVKDISAGGIRIRLNKHDPVVGRFGVADLAMTHIVADNGEGKENLSLWLLGEVVLVRAVGTSLFTDVSLTFRKWASDPAEGEDFAWFPVEKGGGVPALAAWVMLRHLEIHRSLSPAQ